MALSLNGKYSKAYGRLAKSYMALGDYDRSIEAYVKATEVSPTDAELMKEYKLCKMVY